MNKLKLILKKLLSYIPGKIPYGKTKYDAWALSIIELAGPVADVDSMRWVIASNVTNLSPKTERVSKRTLVNILHMAAAKQIAGAVFTEIKEKQKAEATAKLNEAAVDTTGQKTSG